MKATVGSFCARLDHRERCSEQRLCLVAVLSWSGNESVSVGESAEKVTVLGKMLPQDWVPGGGGGGGHGLEDRV